MAESEDTFLAGIAGFHTGRAQGRQAGYAEGDADGYNEGVQKGYQDGHADGRHAGYVEGRQAGYSEGRQAGYSEGWYAGHDVGWKHGGTRTGNAVMDEAQRQAAVLLRAIEGHVQDKAALIDSQREQREMIAALEGKIAALRTEADAQVRANTLLRGTVAELTTEVTNTGEQLQAISLERNGLLWEHNRCMLLLNSMRGVLDKLAIGSSVQAADTRMLFAEKYHLEVEGALARGTIDAPPDADDTFQKQMPNTHRFIVRLLENARDDFHAGAPEYNDMDVTPDDER